jgi:hypothetical protein
VQLLGIPLANSLASHSSPGVQRALPAREPSVRQTPLLDRAGSAMDKAQPRGELDHRPQHHLRPIAGAAHTDPALIIQVVGSPSPLRNIEAGGRSFRVRERGSRRTFGAEY